MFRNIFFNRGGASPPKIKNYSKNKILINCFFYLQSFIASLQIRCPSPSGINTLSILWATKSSVLGCFTFVFLRLVLRRLLPLLILRTGRIKGLPLELCRTDWLLTLISLGRWTHWTDTIRHHSRAYRLFSRRTLKSTQLFKWSWDTRARM